MWRIGYLIFGFQIVNAIINQEICQRALLVVWTFTLTWLNSIRSVTITQLFWKTEWQLYFYFFDVGDFYARNIVRYDKISCFKSDSKPNAYGIAIFTTRASILISGRFFENAKKCDWNLDVKIHSSSFEVKLWVRHWYL